MMAVGINVWQHNQAEPFNMNQIIVQKWYYILALSVIPIILYFVRKYWLASEPGLPYDINREHAN
jgi:hypothetical protein